MKIQSSKFKIQNYNLKFKIIFFVSLLTFNFALLTSTAVTDTLAQAPCGVSSQSRATGLVSSPKFEASSKFYTSFLGSGCIIDPKAAFTPFKLPSFDDLKSLYFDQAKTTSNINKHGSATGNRDNSHIPMSAGSSHIYHIKKSGPSSSDGDLTISGPITPVGNGGNQTGLVFVEGNLIINTNITYGTPNSGLVFIVKGDINISETVTQIDAILVSEGIICTAHNGTVCPVSNVTATQLVINGSLISLNADKPIQFKRNLANNVEAAEKINHEVKYLVLLRNIFSDTLQRWSEVYDSNLAAKPSPTPSELPAKRVFITSSVIGGAMGGVAGADNRCRLLANAYGLGNNWKAWISDASGGPSTTFTQNSGPYRLLNGTRIANNWADLTDGSLRSPINVDETKTVRSQDWAVWTWTNYNGTPRGGDSHCGYWTISSRPNPGNYWDYGGVGDSRSSSFAWTQRSDGGIGDHDRACNTQQHLYCFEQ